VRENHLEGRAAFQEGNAFDELRRWEREGRTFDAIVLDPPAFARDVHALPGARRGYKEINLRAMRLVRPGGYLVTSSCSSPLSRQAFLDMLQEAAADNGQQVTLLGLYGAAPDHPVRLAQPQADYLKCAFLRVETPPVRTLARRDQRE
jgi:23S rRNA (cytosine1962-C5)-methyltransferase